MSSQTTVPSPLQKTGTIQATVISPDPTSTPSTPSASSSQSPSRPVQTKPNGGKRLGRNTLRQFRLDGVYVLIRDSINTFRANTSPKTGHVAIYKDRKAAFLSALVHLFCLAGVVVLGYFIFRKWWIGGELQGAEGQDSQKILALQFTTKVFELLVVFSLSTMIFTVIRYELVLGNGVPLAAISAGLQISDPTFLISKALLAIVKGQFSRMHKKIFLVVLIVAFTILAAVIAPATATALIPRKSSWRVGGANIWWTANESTIFPSVLDASHIGRPLDAPDDEEITCDVSGRTYCPSYQWDVIGQRLLYKLPRSAVEDSEDKMAFSGTLLPRTILVEGRETGLQMTVDVRYIHYPPSFIPQYTIATMAHASIVDGLITGSVGWARAAQRSRHRGETRYDRNAGLTFRVRRLKVAATHARCIPRMVNTTAPDTVTFADFRYDWYPHVDLPDPFIMNWLNVTLPTLSESGPQALFIDLLEPNGGMQGALDGMARNASIAVVIAVPNHLTPEMTGLYGCLIDARWVTTEVNPDVNSLVAPGTPPDFKIEQLEGGWVRDQTYGQRVHMRPDFARYINPLRSGDDNNRTVLQHLLRRTDNWHPGEDVAREGMHERHVEAILCTLMTNAMARSSINRIRPVTNLADSNGTWWRNFLPQGRKVFGPGSMGAYEVSEEEKGRFYSAELEAWADGYGYAPDDLTILLSLVCLLVYGVCAVVFIVWSLGTGITSTSWDTIPELLAMALQSPPPGKAKLSGVSAGIMTTRPMEQRYCVASEGVSGKDRTLRLVAVDGNGQLPRGERVLPNTVYD